VFLLLIGLGAAQVSAQISWDDERWEVAASDSRVEEFLGRDALVLAGGTAWLTDVEMRDGVIEFDFSADAVQGFHGVRFRAVDRFNHEHIYLRPHQSGNPDAVQYNPIFNAMSGWQIYSDERYALPVVMEPNRWVHVRLAVEGSRAELTVDGVTLVFPDLVRDAVSGAIGLSSSGAPARFANVVVRPNADPEFVGGDGAPPVEAEPGTVSRWRISDAFREELVDGVVDLPASVREDRHWSELDAEVRGIANIGRLTGARDEGRNTVFAALTIQAETAGVVRARLGFSDRVRAFLNGRQLFAASDGYRSRDYRFLGTMGLHDELFLPLEAGDNELWLAVSEDFGGWGVSLQLPEIEGISVTDPAGNRLTSIGPESTR